MTSIDSKSFQPLDILAFYSSRVYQNDDFYSSYLHGVFRSSFVPLAWAAVG